ncbi:MAG TPA: MYXO-CTERM sorting domain-containing protein [Polyangia bacterium]
MSLFRPLAFATGSLLLAIVSGAAQATVMQPTTNEVMPVATPAAEISVITSRGFPADADTLAGLFKYHVINGVMGADMSMDPIADAHTTPGTFSPQCGLTGTIVVRGGGCKNELGWYNATENPATKPADNQIYTLVPSNLQAAPPNGLMCMDNDFCPLATHMTSQMNQHTWMDYDFAQNIRTSTNYKGGLIGLAMKGLAGSQCPQTKYSQADLNDKNAAGMPWVSVLIYQSVADPQSYYIAFEDQPTCTQSWRGCTGNQPNQPGNGNDGDFNDFVFFVSGLSCNLGGDPCTVPGQMGICAGGVTECAGGGTTTTCRQAVMPSTEVCDNVDNDCDGMVDNGDGLCPPGQVCSQGVCRHPCDDTEFPCAVGLSCDSSDGLCKDRACIGMTCGAGQVCRQGTCIGGCEGVMCPHGQTCRLGACVAACDGVTCPADRVCENGACQPPCNNKCRTCKAGTTCNMTSGVCLETGCENTTCPAGQVCIGGSCKDGCTDVICPGGQACMNGSCTPVAPPDTGSGGAGGGGGSVVILGNGGAGGNTSTGAAGYAGAGPGTGNSGGAAMETPHMISTCKCETAEGPSAAGVALLLAGVAVAAGRRHRRRAAARARR